MHHLLNQILVSLQQNSVCVITHLPLAAQTKLVHRTLMLVLLIMSIFHWSFSFVFHIQVLMI